MRAGCDREVLVRNGEGGGVGQPTSDDFAHGNHPENVSAVGGGVAEGMTLLRLQMTDKRTTTSPNVLRDRPRREAHRSAALTLHTGR